jgi:hypothetical protein
LYAGDEHRVQEFTTAGHWVREIALARISDLPESDVTALAVNTMGDIYLVYHAADKLGLLPRESDIVREFAPSGREVMAFPVRPRRSGYIAKVEGMAFNPGHQLVVIGLELGTGRYGRLGLVYDPGTGDQVAEFPFTADNDGGFTFDGAGDMILAATDEQEVLVFTPTPSFSPAVRFPACSVNVQGDPLPAFALEPGGWCF